MMVFLFSTVPAGTGGADYSAALLLTKSSQDLSWFVYKQVGDGQQANNPWLQEFPDPTRVSWDNYVTVSNADAKYELSNEIVANGGLNGSYATITQQMD
jgi:molybdopterin-containing oxidoreductase family iron-sulfur binding subunit